MTEAGRPALLVLVRHAESARNQAKKGATYFADDAARRVLRGIPDHEIPLTADGHEQARQTGVALRDRFGVFDCVYTSGYARTEQTAEGILAAYSAAELVGTRVRAELFIRERDSGYAYDMTEAEAEAAFPWLAEYWRTFGSFLARPPGGESLADVVTRVHTFLDTIGRERPGQRVLAVTHGQAIRCFRFVLEQPSFRQDSPFPRDYLSSNCGVTSYQAGAAGDRLELIDANQVYWTVGQPEDGGVKSVP